jgi:hypothetical protein
MKYQEDPEKGQSPFDWKGRMPFAPIVVSFLAVVVWLVFILLFALYWSTGFNLFQDVIVTIVSLLVMGLLVGLVWVVWGMRFAKPSQA